MSAVAQGLACCICGQTSARVWRVAHDNLLGGDESFTDVRCTNCAMVRLQPRPPVEEMGRYYTASTYARAEDEDGSRELSRRLDAFFSHQADRAMGAMGDVAPGRILDVGCGDGRFLAAMMGRGWIGEGIETDGVAAALARRRASVTIHETPLEDASLAEESFDLVSLLHVLEHVPDPRATTAEAYRLLKPGGTLLLALPNVWCLEAVLFGANWYPLDLPRHYWGFSPRHLTRLVAECGFERPRLRYLPFFFAIQSLRYTARALRKQTTPTAKALLPTSKSSESQLQTRLFLAILAVSERLGTILPGEVMELTATKPREKAPAVTSG